MKKVIIDKDLLEQYYCKDDLSIAEISRRTGISVKTVKKNIKEHGIVKELPCYADKQWLIEQHYEKNLDGKHMAELAGCNKHTIYHYMRKYKIPFQTFKRLYEDNDNYFVNIDTERKAYWLGFLMADGHVTSDHQCITVVLSLKDKHHLEMFLEDIESTRPVKVFSRYLDETKSTYEMCRIDITSKKMALSLSEHGFTNNKSLKEVLPNMSEEMYRHFIRGYFDGDGGFSYGTRKNHSPWCTASMLGGEDFLKSVCEKIKEQADLDIKFYTKSNELKVLSSGDNSAIQLMNWLYKDATVFLDRKYNKFQEYLSLAS